MESIGSIVFIILWLATIWLFGFWTSRIFRRKSRDPVKGWIVGLVFGPAGVLISALLPTRSPELMQSIACPCCHFNNEVPTSITVLDCDQCDHEIVLTPLSETDDAARFDMYQGECICSQCGKDCTEEAALSGGAGNQPRVCLVCSLKMYPARPNWCGTGLIHEMGRADPRDSTHDVEAIRAKLTTSFTADEAGIVKGMLRDLNGTVPEGPDGRGDRPGGGNTASADAPRIEGS